MLTELDKYKNEHDNNFIAVAYRLAPRVMDYLREIFLYRGKVLFVEEDGVFTSFHQKKIVLRTLLLFCLTYFFKCSAFETWQLINSQVTVQTPHALSLPPFPRRRARSQGTATEPAPLLTLASLLVIHFRFSSSRSRSST